jgi:hypothetical protein
MTNTKSETSFPQKKKKEDKCKQISVINKKNPQDEKPVSEQTQRK